MYTRSLHAIIATVLLIALCGILCPTAVADTGQTWYFTTDDAPAPLAADANYNKIMTKGIEGGDSVVTLAAGERVWFYTDEVAACDVSFPPEKWTISYWIRTPSPDESSTRLTTKLHYMSQDGSEDKIKGGYNDIGYEPVVIHYTKELTPDDSFTVPSGGRIAVEILWSSGAKGNLEIHCNPPGDNVSSAYYNAMSPSYPTPELPTILLLSAGIMVIGGYLWWRRRGQCEV